jgi:hypothetical protein
MFRNKREGSSPSTTKKCPCDETGKRVVFRMQILKVQILPRALPGSLMVEHPAHNG